MTFSMLIENVRRIERVHLTLDLGSRTILVGRNNVGKTTLLDIAVRALWSMPAQIAHDGWRAFSTTWYRRAASSYLRPKVTLGIPASVLDPDLCVQANAIFNFVLMADHLDSAVRGDRHEDTRLIAVAGDMHADGQTRALFKPQGAWADRLSQQSLSVSAGLESDASWQKLDATVEPTFISNQT
jgi:ABC-type molybdenum transport system ATPase subunit/photorepair protein PhrA